MRRPLYALLIAAAALPAAAAPNSDASAESVALQTAIAAPTRTPANVARDPARHPAGTLSFFGVRPTDTIVELWPGGGWYTEILGITVTVH